MEQMLHESLFFLRMTPRAHAEDFKARFRDKLEEEFESLSTLDRRVNVTSGKF